MISLIAAVAQNRAIGYRNRLLYWLPNDLRRFKALTSGHTIIMGPVFVIGGASVYEQALPLADRLCLTEIDDIPATTAPVLARHIAEAIGYRALDRPSPSAITF